MLHLCDSWFRAGIEHFFAHMKRFAILRNDYRGLLQYDHLKTPQAASSDSGNIVQCDDVLAGVVRIIASTLSIRIQATPLRIHIPMGEPDEEPIEELDHLELAARIADEKLAASNNDSKRSGGIGKRLAKSGAYDNTSQQSIGNYLRPKGDGYHDLRVGPNGTTIGYGHEPSDETVDSGFKGDDFKEGERIWIWFWAKWWGGTFLSYQRSKGTATIRFAWNNNTVSKYKPRLLFPASYVI